MFANHRCPAAGKIGAALVAAVLLASPAGAHVYLDTPNGGETFEVGSIVTVAWTVLQSHEMDNWDVEYSTAGVFGPYVPAATDLPEGDSSVGTVHSYDWTVPDAVSATVRVKAIQDLPDMGDYEDFSDADFSIIPLQSTGRLRLLRLNRPLADFEEIFHGLPCTRISDLRICSEAPGAPRNFNDPPLPFTTGGAGDLVLLELDSDLAASGTADRIMITKGANGSLVVEWLP